MTSCQAIDFMTLDVQIINPLTLIYTNMIKLKSLRNWKNFLKISAPLDL
jgi:hypothetical protein